MDARKALLAVVAALMLLLGAGVVYAQSGTGGEDDDGDDSYKGSVSAPDRGGASLRESAKVDRPAAEEAALGAVPGEVHEIELETSDDGYVVYDVEVAGDDGNNYEVKVDAGNGEVLHRDLEDEADDSDSGETDDSD